MTAAEYKKLRKQIGTLMEVGAMLGLDKSTVWKRESGRVDVNKEAEFAIRYLARTTQSNKK